MGEMRRVLRRGLGEEGIFPLHSLQSLGKVYWGYRASSHLRSSWPSVISSPHPKPGYSVQGLASAQSPSVCWVRTTGGMWPTEYSPLPLTIPDERCLPTFLQ